MIASIVRELGPWNWMVLGFALLILELMAPGVFLLWFGIAAMIVGVLSLIFWDAAFWVWQLQVPVFAVLGILAALIGQRIMLARRESSDEPLLNQRGKQLIGRTATLTEPIREGRGRIQLGDTLWRVSGPDLPVGARVRVVSASSTDLDLVVEAVP
ncbi:NfeD family protein [Salmonella enterica subsp. enterica serovar Typhi]|nr:NfeD family protein [Salmonella enterica subsp. enterica serovar Typhi]